VALEDLAGKQDIAYVSSYLGFLMLVALLPLVYIVRITSTVLKQYLNIHCLMDQ